MTNADPEPAPQARGCVGIFWVFKGRLLALPVALDQAERREGKIDSPHAHAEEWPRVVARHRSALRLLSVLDYDEVPRGRVLFDTRKRIFIAYLDASLFESPVAGKPVASVRAALLEQFRLGGERVRYATDPHYRLPASEPEDDEDL
jgi:hypothetical protein